MRQNSKIQSANFKKKCQGKIHNLVLGNAPIGIRIGGIRPQHIHQHRVAFQRVVLDSTRTRNRANLIDRIDAANAAVHAENALVDDGSQRQNVEQVVKRRPDRGCDRKQND